MLARIPCPWNPFEHALVSGECDLVDEPFAAAPGEYVELEARMDLLPVLSACSSTAGRISGDSPRGVALDLL